MKKSVTWVPASNHGTHWRAYHNGILRGYVQRLITGRFQATAFGRSNCYVDSMREAGKRVVAHVNNIYPGRIK